MKKQLKKLSLTKKVVANFEVVNGGKGPQTFLAQGCGTSIAYSECICGPDKSYFDESCGACRY
ncbi:MAG: hypothetical protein AB8B65_03745 [Kordia sp.]|uniref:hypothetical protein n=1 Tax=Kordia sp. TaxID=1965332 RepID=UPI00385B8910